MSIPFVPSTQSVIEAVAIEGMAWSLAQYQTVVQPVINMTHWFTNLIAAIPTPKLACGRPFYQLWSA